MNENMTSFEDDMFEISISDLVLTVLKKWPIILVSAVLFAMLLGGLKGMRSMSGSGALSEDAQKAYELELEQYELQMEYYEHQKEVYEFDLKAKEEVLEIYRESVKQLEEELSHLKEIPEDDETARLASMIRITHLKTVYNDANGTLQFYFDRFAPPEEPEMPEELQESPGHGFHFSRKFALLGFVFGGFFACFGFALIYIFDGTVKKPDTLSRLYNVRLLGSGDKADLVAANVRNYIPAEVDRILITGSGTEDNIALIADAVSSKLGYADCIVAERLNTNAAAADKLSEADAVILVEKLKVSKLDSIRDEIRMVQNAGKLLVGIAI